MLISMWSLKGGQGTSTTAAVTAICAAQDRDRPVRPSHAAPDTEDAVQLVPVGHPATARSWCSAWTRPRWARYASSPGLCTPPTPQA